MALLVVAYPQLTFEDRQWMQAMRERHDSHYPIIEPHFTLVFPNPTIDQQVLVEQVTSATQQLHSFAFILRCALVVKDAFSPKRIFFWFPDKGFSTLVKLHDALYTGPLAPALRLDVPFIPHITIGDNDDPQVMKAVADEINGQSILIRGSVLTIDILRYEAGVVETIQTIALV